MNRYYCNGGYVGVGVYDAWVVIGVDSFKKYFVSLSDHRENKLKILFDGSVDIWQ